MEFALFDYSLLNYFFFQAEDGIRDTSVTGVQTCALPISGAGAHPRTGPEAPRFAGAAVPDALGVPAPHPRRLQPRSEERRVGKSAEFGGCRSDKKKKTTSGSNCEKYSKETRTSSVDKTPL